MRKLYGNIAHKYAGFVLKLYEIVNIVFGYRVGVTKRQRTSCPWCQCNASHSLCDHAESKIVLPLRYKIKK